MTSYSMRLILLFLFFMKRFQLIQSYKSIWFVHKFQLQHLSETIQSSSIHSISYNPGIAASGHLPLSKTLWSQIVKPGDIVIDATCGNGLDSLDMAKLSLSSTKSSPTGASGKLVCIDIQEMAIEATKKRLMIDLPNYSLVENYIQYLCQSHETFPTTIEKESVSLINYNLGYLPRGGRGDDFTIGQGPITSSSTTLMSLSHAIPLIKVNGMITVSSYRGHSGGEEEYQSVNEFCSKLDSKRWRVYSHIPLNRPSSPVLFSIYRIKS